jgi:hypothetical protein
MVRGGAGRIHRERAHARRQVVRDEREVAGEGVRPLHPVVHAHGGIVGLARVRERPSVKVSSRRACPSEPGSQLKSPQITPALGRTRQWKGPLEVSARAGCTRCDSACACSARKASTWARRCARA